MRTIPMTLLAASLALGLAACSDRQDGYDDAATPPAATEAPAAPVAPTTPAATADMTTTPAAGTMAILAATEGNSVTGEITFAAVDGGVAITGQVNGLPPNTEHGFHVHETGDCSAPDGTSAGGHFNPTDSAHGRVSAGEHHVGDTDNIRADDTGVARVDTRLDGATLADGAPTDVLGRAVIVHADPDDYATQPTGNAGARLACGVITQAM
ncbi:superoxide dismutase family protein [Luteimonas changyuni]|uniref:superoxide dismutase family protein n=1 Tax=Luteimonas sp. MJ145 TaxID=3129234 RepID=UPI0031BB8D4B